MTENRIQKLLFNEYSDFEDIVLIESPFAQTTKDGTGVRQVQMGLTPTKLILAGDIMEKDVDFDPTVQIDPHIDTLELLSLFPVECVNMSVYRHKNRNTLKAHFCNDQVIYFELASSLKREMFWNLWCERIKFLNPEDECFHSTHSETSVGSTSVSTSTAYGQKDKNMKTLKHIWNCKDLFLGENFGQGDTLIERKPKGQPHIPREKDIGDKRANGKASQVCLVNRFGEGISENCCTNLFLPVQVYVTPQFDLTSDNSAKVEEVCNVKVMSAISQPLLIDQNNLVRHRRRYGIAPLGILFNGFGSIRFDHPQMFTLQLKRCCSEVHISKNENDLDDILGFPRRLLTSSLSCDCLTDFKKAGNETDNTPVRGSSKYNFYHGHYFFWTTNFWYRPMKPRYGYKKLMHHLENVQLHHKILDMKRRKVQLWTMTSKNRSDGGETRDQTTIKQNSFIKTLMNSTKVELEITSWDFTSTLISYQLTDIDKDLFTEIPVNEFAVLLHERSVSNTPHIRAMLVFAERVINLITTEIIRFDSVKLRAKLIAKFINVARRLEHLQNLHTTKTVLLSLQTPAIYRLKKTWTYIRNHHNKKYRRLYNMLKTHKEIRSKTYGVFFGSITQTRPFLPALLHIIAALFGKLSPTLFRLMSSCNSNEQLNKEYYRLVNQIPLWATISDDSNISEAMLARSSSSSISSLNAEGVINRIRTPSGQNPLLLSFAKTNSHLEMMMLCMEEWQRIAHQFGLVENPILKEFLLKSEYMEQDECFKMSLKAEPPDPLLKKSLPHIPNSEIKNK